MRGGGISQFSRKGDSTRTLLIEGHLKSGKKSEFITIWNREIPPTLKNSPASWTRFCCVF